MGWRAFALLATSLILGADASLAATNTYTPAASGTDQWAAGTNWSAGVPVSATDTELKFVTNFSNSGAYTSNNNIAGIFTLDKMTFSGSNWGQTLNLTGNTIKFSGANRLMNLDSTVGSAYYYIKAPLASDGALTVQGNGGAIFHIFSQLSDGSTPAALIKNGNSELTLWAQSYYSGGTTLNAGVLTLDASNALGSGTLTITGGILDSDYGFNNTYNNPQVWNGNVTFAGSGSGDGNLGAGAVAINANRTVTVNRRTLVVGGSIGDGGNGYGITKSGSGALKLSGSSTYTGATVVSSGTLIVSGSLADASPVTVGNSLSLTTPAKLGGSGMVGNVTALGNTLPANTGATIDPGNAANVGGILGTINLTVTNGAHLAMQVGGRTAGGDVTGAYDEVMADGTVNVTGGALDISVNGTPWLAPKDTIFLVSNNGGAAVTGTFGTVTLNGTAVTDITNIVLNGRQFQLVYNAKDTGAGSDGMANDIALVAVPDFWQPVPIGGGGYVTGLVTNASGDSIYCHTDVGGAFRWDAIHGEWVNITDEMVPPGNTYGDKFMGGILSVAIDPTNSSKIYVAAGTYVGDSVRGIFASSDAGNTWTQIQSTVVVQGNGGSKFSGERLAVDPNNPNILWYGSSQDGLQKGVYTSGTWAWTQVPSTSVPFGQVPVTNPATDKMGVTFVACDKNNGSTIVYAGVYDSVGFTGGVYMSADGTNWSLVPGISMPKPMRAQVAVNGTLYVTEYGIVGKLVRGGAMTNVTPVASVNYGGVGVALSDTTGNTVYVAEANGGAANGKLWRTTNGGTSWTGQSGSYTKLGEPDGTASAVRDGSHWFSNTAALMVSATNANELWASDFMGVLRTQDAQDIGATGTSATWNSLSKGQEEFCVQALKSSTNGPVLMSGGADISGFRHNDVTVRPIVSGSGGRFGQPYYGSTTSLDYCESNPNIWARGWNNPSSQTVGSGAVSVNGGISWYPFGGITCKNITNTNTSRWESWDVTPYLASQKTKGATLVTLVVYCGSKAAPAWLQFFSKELAAWAAPTLKVNGTTSLATTADAFTVNSDSSNYGSATWLQCEYDGQQEYIYLKFDLSSISTPITSATLSLYTNGNGTIGTYPIGVLGCANTTWSESTLTGANKPATYAGATDPVEGPTYYVGGIPLAGGRVAVSSTNPNAMVWMPEGMANHAYYSTDRGTTWASGTGSPASPIRDEFYPGAVIQPLTADRFNGKFYLAQFNGPNYYDMIYTSTDGGANWVLTGSVPAHGNVWRTQIVAAPAANDVWLCDDGTSYPSLGALWRSTNGGANWTQIANGTINGVREVSFGKALSTGTTAYSVFINGYKNGVNGIYQSDDYGATWTLLGTQPTGVTVDVLEGDRRNYGRVYLGTNGRGIFQGQR